MPGTNDWQLLITFIDGHKFRSCRNAREALPGEKKEAPRISSL